MALKPEFIGLLRDIRDRIYPEIFTWYYEIGVMHTNIQTIEANIEAIEASIHNISIGTVTTIENLPDDTHGIATASYDGATSTINLGIPAGDKGTAGEKGDVGANGNTGQKGDTGDAYQIDVEDLFSTRSTYDTEVKAFSFLAIDTSMVYFKLSSVSGDWSVGTPFGRGTDGVNGLEADRNIIVNPKVNIGQREGSIAANVDWLNVPDETFGADMWIKKAGTEKDFYQTLYQGREAWKLNTEYTLSVKKYDKDVFLAEYATVLMSPSSNIGWEILINNPAPEAVSGVTRWSIQLEEGILVSDHVKTTEMDDLYKCMKYYTKTNKIITLPIVDNMFMERKLDITLPIAMVSGPTVNLFNSTNGVVVDTSNSPSGGELDGIARLTSFGLIATVIDGSLQSYCEGYEAGVSGQL